MKPGAYICDDQRTGAGASCAGLVRVYQPKMEDGHEVLTVFCATGHPVILPWRTQPPDFLDDEAAGVFVLPTLQGLVKFRWPTAEDYAALVDELGDEYPDAPPASATDDERQEFMRALC